VKIEKKIKTNADDEELRDGKKRGIL